MATWYLMWKNPGLKKLEVGEYQGQSLEEMKKKAKEIADNGNIQVRLVKKMGYVYGGGEFQSSNRRRK